jgi:hypothetical protein
MPRDLVDIYRALISIGEPLLLKPGQGQGLEGLKNFLG